MRGVLAFLILLSIFGCGQAKEKEVSVPALNQTVVEQAVATIKEEAAPVVQEVKKIAEDLMPAAEVTGKAEVTVPAPVATQVVAAQGGEALIDKGAWGFSVYNPLTKTTKFYTAIGGFLGERAEKA